MRHSESLDKINTALAKCLGEIEPPKKSGSVDYNSKKGRIKFDYSTLGDLKEVSRKPLADNGLSIIQPLSGREKDVVVTTRLSHSSGQWIESDFSIPAMDLQPQTIGSIATYIKRYSYAAMLNIPDCDDDDGQAAAGLGTPKKQDANKNPNYDSSDNNHKQILVKKAHSMGITDMDYCKKIHHEAGKRDDVKLSDIESFINWFAEQNPVPHDVSQV